MWKVKRTKREKSTFAGEKKKIENGLNLARTSQRGIGQNLHKVHVRAYVNQKKFVEKT